MNLRDELDRRFPVMADNARHQRAAAIKLFCLECMGGSQKDAAACQVSDCRLWPFAYRKQRRTHLDGGLRPPESAGLEVSGHPASGRPVPGRENRPGERSPEAGGR